MSNTANEPTIVLSVLEQHRDRFFSPQAIERLGELGNLVIDPDPAEHASEESKAALADAEVVVSCWNTGNLDALVPNMPNFKMLVHSAGTVRKIASEDIFDHGVRVSSQTDINAVPVAEYTVAMILLGAKNIFASRRAYIEQRDKPSTFWDRFQNIGLYGCKVGIIGLSRISRKVIELLKPYHVNILVSSGHLSEEEAAKLGVEVSNVEEILSTCDVISLHTALTPKTEGMLGAEHFKMIRDDAVFINTARGALLDQDAFIEELKKDRFTAVIDVTYPEVNVPDSPLWTLPNVFLTPHAAGSMGRELRHLGDGAVDDVKNYLAGKPVAGEFTKEQYAGRA
ncbi:MAG: hydroxyacid dehydrogenase [Actinomycetaceae bacterium]|nr:hydroxyacid dehydrogenase [Actinomycetaceae bacterium]